ncbi:MAG: hypothetical protein F4185_02760 [Chloroflexi bacterium]|nr:hypothetical protein [Chloroflexota bacterium]MYF64886.1 hypothetical protein [Chloroflexota bacterium]MYK35671.1 hypothetical protein [Chloroflexota bacterium]
MRTPRLHTAIPGALVIACLAVACSSEPAPTATPTLMPVPTATPTPVPPPTPGLPAFGASGNTGGKVGDSASEFTGITQWLNSEPLTMEEMRGKVVLIDFWTYI